MKVFVIVLTIVSSVVDLKNPLINARTYNTYQRQKASPISQRTIREKALPTGQRTISLQSLIVHLLIRPGTKRSIVEHLVGPPKLVYFETFGGNAVIRQNRYYVAIYPQYDIQVLYDPSGRFVSVKGLNSLFSCPNNEMP